MTSKRQRSRSYKPRKRGRLGPYTPKGALRRRYRSAAMRNARTGGYLGIERKFLDATKTASAIVADASGAEQDPATLNCLNGIDQGDGESQRDGRKYVIKDCLVRGVVELSPVTDQADAETARVVRLLLIHDTQTNGAQFNGEDVLVDNNAISVWSPRNLQYSSRFKVLRDEMVTLDWTNSHTDGTNTGTIGGQAKPFSWYFKNLNIPVTCSGTGATVSAITDNSLHIMALADATGATLTYHSRIRFVG